MAVLIGILGKSPVIQIAVSLKSKPTIINIFIMTLMIKFSLKNILHTAIKCKSY